MSSVPRGAAEQARQPDAFTVRAILDTLGAQATRMTFDRAGGAMRLRIALLMTTLMLVGCSPGAGALPSPVDQGTSAAPSAAASSGADVPADDPSLQRVDADGRTPDETVLALIDALNKSDWPTAYSFYAEPWVDLATASREWADAQQTYVDFRVLEVRVTGPVREMKVTDRVGMASVRVFYDGITAPPDGEPYRVRVQEPGEWWAVYKIGGRWKVQWMPRQ
jgi:hypothetical protein